MFMTKTQQFSYRAIISAKIVASLQTAALQKSGIKLFALSSQQLTGNAQVCLFIWGAEIRQGLKYLLSLNHGT